MRIKEFAERLNISQYTLRFYEKVGVLNPIKRKKNGYREYDENDIGWMEFVLKLKDTGMPLKKIVEYAELRSHGKGTRLQRQKLLQEHEGELIKRIGILKSNLTLIQKKIEFYTV